MQWRIISHNFLGIQNILHMQVLKHLSPSMIILSWVWLNSIMNNTSYTLRVLLKIRINRAEARERRWKSCQCITKMKIRRRAVGLISHSAHMVNIKLWVKKFVSYYFESKCWKHICILMLHYSCISLWRVYDIHLHGGGGGDLNLIDVNIMFHSCKMEPNTTYVAMLSI